MTQKGLDAQTYRRTKKGLITIIYNNQKSSSKERKHLPPTYSQKELREWLMSQPLFHVLYDNWKRLDYQSDYSPSVDRKEDSVSYTMSNIQVMTWGENKAKGWSDRKNGTNNSVNIAIIQLTKGGKYIAEHHSIIEASRITNITRANISKVCSGERKSAGGFKWKYKGK